MSPSVRDASSIFATTLHCIYTPGRFTGLHRARLLSVFFDSLGPNCTMHTSKRLSSYTQLDDTSKPLQLIFQDGSKVTCDVLIGADGVKSVVRQQLVEELAIVADQAGDLAGVKMWRALSKPAFSGLVNCRQLVPLEKLESLSPSHPSLTGAHLVSDGPVFLGDKLMLCLQFAGKNCVSV
jgi:salicylate hydroxylase